MKPDSISPPAGATAFTTNDDADIIAAWDRLRAANDGLDAIVDQNTETPEMVALWKARDAAESDIQAATANTVLGVEMQLWCNLMHSVPKAADESAVLRRDIQYFTARDEQWDWTERLILSAIRSLRAMGGEA